jgi:hypothetical protein
MIIMIMPIQHVSADFTTLTHMAATTTIITPTHTGMTRIPGILDSVFIWAITGGEQVLDMGMGIRIMDMDILITGMGILITGTGMAAMVADTTITIIHVIITVMITIQPIMATAVLLPLQETAHV